MLMPLFGVAQQQSSHYISGKSPKLTFDVVPETFELNVYRNGVKEQASNGLRPMPVTGLIKSNSHVSWVYPTRHISIDIKQKKNYLDVTINSEGKERLVWPRLQADSYMLPLWEGKYIPATDSSWSAFLKGQDYDFLESFSMGFLASNKPKYAIVYVLKNLCNNKVDFNTDSAIKINFVHEFTSIDKQKTYGFRIYLTDNKPLAITQVYKHYIQEKGRFETLEQKALINPNVRKLYGAPQVYFWTHGIITQKDIHWNELLENWNGNEKIFNWLNQLLSKYYDTDLATEFAQTWQACKLQGDINESQKVIITNALNKALTLKELYDPAIFADEKITKPPTLLSEQQLYAFNKSLMKIALKNEINNPEEWGKGDVNLLVDLYRSGIHKAWIGLPDWADGLMNPLLVQKANKLGYLIAPYDSYNDIQKQEDKAWLTAWFPDSSLYNNATISNSSGHKIEGFLNRGRELNPTLAFPAVKERVANILRSHIPYNSWFVDCDATGVVYDDYSPEHITTEKEDISARLFRMNYIGTNVRMVVGSEGGNDFASQSISFAQGLEMPVMRWGDPDLRENKNSLYYLGSYWGGPEKIPGKYTKVVPIKPLYRQVYLNPVYSLPLFRLVYNNCVITTAHWESGSLKIKNEVGTRMLSELLYNTPPLYHIDKTEWDKNKAVILKQVKVWSRLHKKAVKLPMTAFNILSNDRLVQQTTFGNDIKVTVNFSNTNVLINHQLIQARSAIIVDGPIKTTYSVKKILE